MWDNINYIINKKRPSSHIEKISVNNIKKYHQPSSIANHLNNYFCNVASDLATSLPKSNRHFKSYLTQYKEKFSFTQVSEVEVFLLLENLNRKGPSFSVICRSFRNYQASNTSNQPIINSRKVS